MFSKSLSPFEELKTNKSVFKSDPEILSCFELNYKFLERHEKPLSLATTRKQENPVNTAQKMASQSSTKQNGETTTEGVPGSIVTYTEKEINTFKGDMAPENTKKTYINRDVKLSVLSFGHFISFSFAAEEVK
ncbi:unnamed protein product, partial [Porites lobata]